VPTTLTIAAGQTTSPSFTVTAVDDALVDGTLTVTVKAIAVGHADGTDTIDVTDDETAQVLTLPFSDDFNDEDANGWLTIDDSGEPSDWQVIGGEYFQLIETAGAFDESYHLGTYTLLNAGTSLTNYRFSVVATPTNPVTTEAWDDGNDIGILFRYVDNNNYYRLSISSRYGFTRLEKK
ncbi:MAG: hypothetical protein GY941_00250, partial [Planctomycetes bacterium]|nr:hypothetical protein [Planctomycetota bacterium]